MLAAVGATEEGVLRLSARGSSGDPLGGPHPTSPFEQVLRADVVPRATFNTAAPGAKLFSTIRALSSGDQRRRPPSPVNTSSRRTAPA